MSIEADDAPAPRLCHLIKWPDFDGYGFNLHAERSNPGQFIGKIDEQSPAQLAGLREGDRIVEVNGVNISNENHRQVVERIKADPLETRLLVVDAQCDAWYRDHELVVRSKQANVVYLRTPVPRPAQVSLGEPAAGASSLETSASDFRHDSIEPPASQPASPAPMSPDSGRGDEPEPEAAHLVTVAAEINRQSPQSPPEDVVREKQHHHHHHQQQQQQQQEPEEQAADLQPDSLSPAAEPMSAQPERQIDTCKTLYKEHDGTEVDSGKSSSSNSSSSSTSGSVADSLEDQSPRQQQEAIDKLEIPAEPTKETSRLDEDDAQTIRNYQDAAAANKIAPNNNNNNNNDEDEDEDVTTPSTQEVASNVKQQQPVADAFVANEQAPKSTLTPNSINNATYQQNNNLQPEEPLKLGQQKNPSTTGNNSYSTTLNLNMTASEMRELIARRKKFDPKKAQMNIRQKYEIIQQM